MAFPRFDPIRHLARLESPGRYRRQAPGPVVPLLFMANVMHELLADAGILPEIRRVTAPGGHLFPVDRKKRPTMAGPPFFLKVSRARAVRTFQELGFRSLPIPQVYRHHYCLLFAKNPEREAR